MNGIADIGTTLTPLGSRGNGWLRRRTSTVARESLASALLASLGHDLRTRLTVIGAAAGNLKGATLSAEDQSEQSDLILTEVGRLNWLLQNIMEWVLEMVDGLGGCKSGCSAFRSSELLHSLVVIETARAQGRWNS